MSTSPLFQTIIADDLREVNRVIRQSLHSDVALISQMTDYIISAGGKRLRPALTILSGRLFQSPTEGLYQLAAMIEFIHTSTLLHDDVVDESGMRRGRETANAVFGNAASVLVGDFLYTRAFQMMVGVNQMKILQVMSESTNIIAEGEVLQLLNIGEVDLNLDDYLKVIRYKTARLFEAAARVGAIHAGATQIEENAIASFASLLGTAFQIIDDALDYSGQAQEIGKNLGDDLAEGKTTLPLIYTMHHGNQEQAQTVRFALQNAARDHFPDVLSAVQSCGALEYTLQIAENTAKEAIEAIECFKGNPIYDALVDLAGQAIHRRF